MLTFEQWLKESIFSQGPMKFPNVELDKHWYDGILRVLQGPQSYDQEEVPKDTTKPPENRDLSVKKAFYSLNNGTVSFPSGEVITIKKLLKNGQIIRHGTELFKIVYIK